MSDILDIKPVTKVDALFQTKIKVMPQELKNKLDNFTPMQKRYAEFRSKGMKQADAAAKAGSTSKDRQALTRTGYNWEQVEGMKEYIAFLYEKRAEASILDEIEIIEGIRKALEMSFELERVDWANKSLELMGNLIGAFSKEPKVSKGKGASQEGKKTTDAFKDEGEEVTQDQRMKDISSLLHSIQKTNVFKDSNK